MPDSRTLDGRASVPERDQETVTGILKGFEACRLRRYSFEVQWQESALLALPEWANTFFFGYDRLPGQKLATQQIDSSVSVAAQRFASICDALCTPFQEMWSRLRHPDDYVMKQRGVKEYYDTLTKRLWDYRYAPPANFMGANHTNWLQLGVFGNQPMLIEELDGGPFGGEHGCRYTSVPVGQMFYVCNGQGVVTGYYRAFKWTAAQIKRRWPDTFPQALTPALEKQSPAPFWIVQYVCLRDDWVPWRLDAKGKRWASYYVSLDGRNILEEGGYRTFPMAIGRYMVAPDEDYGRGPLQIALASAKTLNSEKGVFLKQGHRAGDPIYLTADDGMMSGDFYPGSIIGGGMSSDGRPKVGIVPTGNVQITQEMMAAEKEIIDDTFLVSLFRLALKTEDQPNLNARQVVEQLEQKGMLIGPTVGRQLQEYLGAMIPRELDILSYCGCLPPVHPAVREAEGIVGYHTQFSNPITRMMSASMAGGYMQLVEMAGTIAQTSQDDSVWDNFDFDTALPEIGDIRGVPTRWLAAPKLLQQKRKARQAAAEQDAKLKSLPGQAAIMKAQAINTKAATGGNIGGTLSGTAPGQMPLVPGNPRGVPGQPGIGGRPGTIGRRGR